MRNVLQLYCNQKVTVYNRICMSIYVYCVFNCIFKLTKKFLSYHVLVANICDLFTLKKFSVPYLNQKSNLVDTAL